MMLKKILIDKFWFSLLLASTCLFSNLTQGAIIAFYDASASVTVSSSYTTNEFETILIDSYFETEGNAATEHLSTGDFGPVTLGANEIGSVDAAISGEVTDIGGFAGSILLQDGYFVIENTTNAQITVDMAFDISLFANIFTSSPDEDALIWAGIHIENSHFETVDEQFLSFDALDLGPGPFGNSDSISVNFSIDIAAGDFEEYYLQLSMIGFAQSSSVPEPTSGILFALGFTAMAGTRRLAKRRMSQKLPSGE